MLASSVPIDLVFVLTADQFHADNIIECADAGKHVMIEKPMAQTLAEYDAVEEARVRNGVVVFVGYMRRYAPALERLKEEIKGKTVKYVRVRDIIGNVGTLCLPVTDCGSKKETFRTATLLPNRVCISTITRISHLPHHPNSSPDVLPTSKRTWVPRQIWTLATQTPGPSCTVWAAMICRL